MWAPVDITALPTAEELVEAKIAIEQVESELKDAHLEPAQLRVANLEKDLKERRAWIAPIRRLSFDSLCLIFEFCGEDNWRTPLRISGVSRLWRTLVLATPRAWAFLPVHKCKDEDEDLIHHFFRHSSKQPIHVFLRKSQQLTILSEATERLECLSVNELSQIKHIPVFPRLKHLSLRSLDERIGLLNLWISRFPALRELICEPTILKVAVSVQSSMKMTFPPLQILSVNIEKDSSWLDLLMGCRSNLVSLRLHFIEESLTSMSEVLLPALRCLEIYLWFHYPDVWPVNMKTPAIETYIEVFESLTPPAGTPPTHEDIGNVTQIHIFYIPNLAVMPLLRTLQLECGVPIADLLARLQSNRSLCPRLEILDLMQAEYIESYEARLVEVNRERSQPISIRRVETWAKALPYEISRSPVSV